MDTSFYWNIFLEKKDRCSMESRETNLSIRQLMTVKKIPYRAKKNMVFIKCITSGILGFSSVIGIMLLLKCLFKILGGNEKSSIELLDFALAGLGFVLKFFEIFLGNLS